MRSLSNLYKQRHVFSDGFSKRVINSNIKVEQRMEELQREAQMKAQIPDPQGMVDGFLVGLNAEEVVILDSTGKEIDTTEEDSNLSSQDTEEIARMVEDQITEKVLHVLIPFYGEENVRVSTKAQINMQTLLHILRRIRLIRMTRRELFPMIRVRWRFREQRMQ